MSTVCFTGHRPKKLTEEHCVDGFKKDFYTDFNKDLQCILQRLITEGCNHFITGGAQGIDQLVFWQLNILKSEYKICNSVYIPFMGQESKWLYDGLFGRNSYNDMLYYADNVVDCSTTATFDGNYVTLMNHRNHCMIDSSDLLVAFITKEEFQNGNIKGGTREAVDYANKTNKFVRYIVTDVIDNRLRVIS